MFSFGLCKLREMDKPWSTAAEHPIFTNACVLFSVGGAPVAGYSARLDSFRASSLFPKICGDYTQTNPGSFSSGTLRRNLGSIFIYFYSLFNGGADVYVLCDSSDDCPNWFVHAKRTLDRGSSSDASALGSGQWMLEIPSSFEWLESSLLSGVGSV